MKDLNLEKHLALFLQTYVPQDTPFLIAVSGGIDSTALLHGLAAASQGREPHVVHIDHGWRENSRDEAQELEKKVAHLKIPFHSLRLPPAPKGVNLEEWSRKERMKYFSELGKFLGTNNIFLAHHADDQIEVVLKRMLEGSSIKNFRGMRAVEKHDELILLRPLLSFRKTELHLFLEQRGISFFDDPTNRDPKFLRARFRTQVLPWLRESFGKEFEASILRISEEASLLGEWIQESLHSFFSFGQTECIAYAASKQKGPSLFLIYHLIDELRKRCALPAPSRSQVEDAALHFLRSPSGSRSFPVGEGVILVEHNWIGVLAKRLQPIEELFCNENQGFVNLSCWEIRWKGVFFNQADAQTWNDLFQGKVARILIPKQPFLISRSSDRLLKDAGKKTAVPTCFRPFVPAITQQNQLVADFLTGYSLQLQQNAPCYEVSVKLKI